MKDVLGRLRLGDLISTPHVCMWQRIWVCHMASMYASCASNTVPRAIEHSRVEPESRQVRSVPFTRSQLRGSPAVFPAVRMRQVSWRPASAPLVLPPTPTAPSMGSGTLRRLGSETSSPVRRIPDTTVVTAAKTVSANSRGFDMCIATRYNAWVAAHCRAHRCASELQTAPMRDDEGRANRCRGSARVVDARTVRGQRWRTVYRNELLGVKRREHRERVEVGRRGRRRCPRAGRSARCATSGQACFFACRARCRAPDAGGGVRTGSRPRSSSWSVDCPPGRPILRRGRGRPVAGHPGR